MNFGDALEELKRGGRVARAGWNGKGMFLFLVPGSTFRVNREPLLSILGEGTEVQYHGHIDMKTAQGYVVPWLASQADMLADDWSVLEPVAPVVLPEPGTVAVADDAALRQPPDWPAGMIGQMSRRMAEIERKLELEASARDEMALEALADAASNEQVRFLAKRHLRRRGKPVPGDAQQAAATLRALRFAPAEG
jgi:hypothetical protein